MSAVLLGKPFPNFDCETTIGKINLYNYIEGSWAILFSHPADYTPVCTTELGKAAKLAPEFKKRGVKMLGFSIDSVDSHNGWIKDIDSYSALQCGSNFPYPLIAGTRRLATDLGMLDPDEVDGKGMPLTARCVFIIGPDKNLKLMLLYPATTGRNFDEILRVIDSLQLTANMKVATPVDWKFDPHSGHVVASLDKTLYDDYLALVASLKQRFSGEEVEEIHRNIGSQETPKLSGQDCMVVPSLTNDQAKERFPKGFKVVEVPSKKPYIRLTPDPSK